MVIPELILATCILQLEYLKESHTENMARASSSELAHNSHNKSSDSGQQKKKLCNEVYDLTQIHR
jgi:hypothetical protein